MPLTTIAALTLNADLTSALDLATIDVPLNVARQYVLASGTGASQADKIFHDRRTLTASSTEDLDLAGVLTDPFGATITFARIKGLFVAAASANTNNVIVGANVVNGWATLIGPTGASGGTITVRPGGAFLYLCTDATAHAVTAGTGDLLHVANSAGGTSVIYDIAVIGASA